MITRYDLIPLSLNGDLRRGGWTVNGMTEGDTNPTIRGTNWIIEGKSLIGYIDNRYREIINCHILNKPDFQFTRYGSRSQFNAGTVDRFLEDEAIQDISFATVGSPANSHENTAWNFGKVINHILEKHCNYIYDADSSNGSPDGVVTLRDVDTTNSTPFQVFIVNQSNNMWSVLQRIGGGEEGGGEFYRIYCTRQNKIVYQPAPPFISPKPTAKGTLTQDLIRGNVQVKYNPNRIGQVQIMTVKDSTTVYSSSYPSNPADGEIYQKKSGIWANSQARSDTLAERLYKWLTREWTIQLEVDIGLALFGDDGRGLELGDRVLLTYDGPAIDTITGHGVHLNLSAQSTFVYNVNASFDHDNKDGVATITLEHDNNP
jgi:hypothetical protein